MAERPVFIPWTDGHRLVREICFDFHWNPGFAPVQKKKNIVALHQAAAAKGYSPLLEVSTKSEEKLGQRLSAFNLKVATKEYGDIPLECAYQGSKVFERGGPFTDLYLADAREAKKDPRVRESGRIVAFRFEGTTFPTEPKTAFYDWLYSRAIYPHREFLRRLEAYAGFTDIEFNPEKSLNCQARSCAIFVAMMKRGMLDRAQESPEQFIAALHPKSSPESAPGERRSVERPEHQELFAGQAENAAAMRGGDDERRDYLYRTVGGALHLAQTLELQLAALISIMNDRFDADLDVDGLIVPDHRKTMGQLLQQLRSVGTLDMHGEQALRDALDKRNHIVHHFFNTNTYAFSVAEVFESTQAKLRADTKAIAIGVAVTQGWVLGLCEALKIDKGKILFKQAVP